MMILHIVIMQLVRQIIMIFFHYSKIIWGCGICEHDKKVQMNYVFPLMIYNNSNECCYVLFSINTSFNDKYHYVETAK